MNEETTSGASRGRIKAGIQVDLALVAASALVAMVLLVLSVVELNLRLNSATPAGALRHLWHLQIGVLLAVSIGVTATLVAVRWLTTATGGLSAARDEIARVTGQLHQEEASERLLQERLVEAARHWAVTFDAIDAAILVVDEEGRLLRLNRFAAAMLGGRPQDFIGQHLSRWERIEPWRRMVEMIAPERYLMVAPDETPSERRRAQREVGDGRYWVISASHHPEIGGTVFLARDGTAIVELRAQLEQRRRGEEMSTFVAGVAHEVRNPLFAITANLQALKEESDKAAVFDEYFGWIESSAARLQVLMQDLLDYARPMSIHLRAGSLSEVIERSVAASAALAGRSGVELRIHARADVPQVLMDPQQLHQVFGNLIENAIALSPAQSTVRISVRRDESSGVVCTVEDSGPGFSPEEIERGFEPFFTRRKGGTGLGLAVVRRIMDGHGGSVDLGNRGRGGARVRLVFPPASQSSSLSPRGA